MIAPEHKRVRLESDREDIAMPTGLQHAIRGHVFERGAPGFQAAAHVYDPRFDHVLPDAVARPLDGADVRDAMLRRSHA